MAQTDRRRPRPSSFDPATESSATTGSMLAGRANHTATKLGSGSVLVVGGHSAFPGESLSSAELYDPTSETFSPAGDMAVLSVVPTPRHDSKTDASSSRVASRRFPLAPTLGTAEIWDPVTEVFVEVEHGMREPRGRHVAVALADGEVLVAGGLGQYGGVLSSAEVYSPSYVDAEPPVLYVPQELTVAANAYDPSGQYVYYYPWATDNSDANPLVTCAALRLVPPGGHDPRQLFRHGQLGQHHHRELPCHRSRAAGDDLQQRCVRVRPTRRRVWRS